MSTVIEIESALKELPLQDVQAVANWVQMYLEQRSGAKAPAPSPAAVKLPDYAARRRDRKSVV